MTSNTATTLLAQQLVQRPSVTPDDAGCQVLLATRLGALGFALEPMPFGDVANLWARYGSEAPLFVFAGHTDVVPPGDLEAWRHDPFGASIHTGLLYGRGAADMKGSIAAMVTACERYLAHHSPRGSIAFLLTSDEEGPARDGTVRVIDRLKTRGEQIDWCLVGEPTSVTELGDTIKNGRRGSLSATLSVHGKQGHVAYPHLANNPVHAASAALTELIHTDWDDGNEQFPRTSLQICRIHAGSGADNVIPGDLEVRFNLRFSPESTADDIRQRVATLLDGHGLDYDIDWRLSGNPFSTEPGDLTTAVSAAIQSVCGIETRLDTGGGTSDGRFIAPTGAQVIELGPLNTTIHQIDECISVADLDILSQVYEQILQRLMA